MVLPIENPTKSYWIEAAESPLRNFRSTPELPKETDVVIVGSGYTGATTAYWLQKYTERNGTAPQMLMLEARDICGGATGRNGGHLRPHAYTHFPSWSRQCGIDGAMELIRHEIAHLDAFKQLMEREGIADEVSFELCETFDVAMTESGWSDIKGAYEAMQSAIGEDGESIRDCRLIENPSDVEDVTQLKGGFGAVVHPAGKIWPYKFVHALLRIVLAAGNLNLQANTHVAKVSSRDEAGWVTVTTPRGDVRAKAVMHATNRWASHLLPEFNNLIFPGRTVMAALDGPEKLLKRTGAQYWDDNVFNYHIQLPPPHNTIIAGGARLVQAHVPQSFILSDDEDKLFDKTPEFYQTWAASHIVDWPGKNPAEFSRDVDEGGMWSGVLSSSIDYFPFVGEVPDRPGHFIAAGYGGHGMPRILLATAHITPLLLDSLGVSHEAPDLVAPYPPLPKAFLITRERFERLLKTEVEGRFKRQIASALESAQKPFCVETRALLGLSHGPAAVTSTP